MGGYGTLETGPGPTFKNHNVHAADNAVVAICLDVVCVV